MVQKIVNKLLKHRHFWRDIEFDELSELYASMLLRSLALNLIGLFIPIYLYKIGYSVSDILFYFTIFFAARIGIDIGVAYVVGRIGPKHSIALSTVFNIIHLLMLMTMREFGWPLFVLAIVGTLTNSLFFIAYHTDFSKIKHKDHGGKELGYMTMLERIGAVIGPLVGGLLATYTDPRFTIFAAILLFAVSLIPLFRSDETVKVHQKITFKGLPIKKYKRYYFSYACLNAENTASVLLWVFYISLVVFSTGTYAKVGAVTAFSTALSLLVAKIVGVLVDNKRANKLFYGGITVNTFVHLLRLLVRTPLTVVGINLLNDPVTICYRMPFVKNHYDMTDNLPGYRIAFIALNESFSAISRSILWGTMFILSIVGDPISALNVGFVMAALFSMGIALQPQPVDNHK